MAVTRDSLPDDPGPTDDQIQNLEADAELGGPAQVGTLSSAMGSKAFRRFFAGTFSSNIGTWMQNITLIALAYELTKNAWFTGVITFAQLGPTLLISPFGGALADRVNRRTLIVSMSAVQLSMSMVLAVVALADRPNQVLLVAVVATIGCANAINGPTMNALLPELVPREDMQPAIAINSVSMNSARVNGPLLGGAIGSIAGSSMVFAINGLTYLFVIWAVVTVEVDFSPKGRSGSGPLRQIREGFSAARANPLILRVLITIASLSLFSLIFIYQMPILAEEHFGFKGWKFNLLFASFALGAAGGALAMGSVLKHIERAKMTKGGLLLFAVSLAIFGTTRIIPIGFISAFIVGAAYFIIVTALSTTIQMAVDDSVRGRVMGLWMMAWAGLVPLGGLIAGPIIDTVGISSVLIFGAVVAAVLGLVMNLTEPDYVAIASHEPEPA
ncbi:MAG TPA: MFS transporter [Microthrixaceae bacterium]|nr:MFS transporter [Microthrixaceae bacterium]